MTKRPVRFVPVDRETFYLERRTACLTRKEAAVFLGVTVRTIRNWENGFSRIPYSAFKLLRLRAGGIVHAQGWDGWRFALDGALFSPCGRSFQSWQLYNMRLVFSMAQHFRESFEAQRLIEHKVTVTKEAQRLIEHQATVPILVPVLCLASGGLS